MPYKDPQERKDYNKNYNIKNKEKNKAREKRTEGHRKQISKKRQQSCWGKYKEYKFSAKKRSIEFTLTFEQFSLLWQQACYYCGEHIKTIGLDRIDNNKGYTVDNVVCCCEKCNKLKNIHTKEELIHQCIKIANKFYGKEQFIYEK